VLAHRHRPEALPPHVIGEPGSEWSKRTGHLNRQHITHLNRLLS
jgi:hypothetical protein